MNFFESILAFIALNRYNKNDVSGETAPARLYTRRKYVQEEIYMAFKSEYLQHVYETVEKRNAGESEFLQAVKEVLESFEPVVEANLPL